ncbi:hypothetical protein D3C84_273970 [compost metagenome]
MNSPLQVGKQQESREECTHGRLSGSPARHALRPRGGPRRPRAVGAAAGAGRRGGCRYRGRRAGGGRQADRRDHRPAQPQRRRGGLPLAGRRGAHTGRLSRRLARLGRGRLGRRLRRSGVRRHGHAQGARRADRGDAQLGQPGLRPLPDADRWRLPGAVRPRQRGTQGALPAQAVQRRVGRGDVPDRAARRHRPGPDSHARRAAA